MKPCADIWRMLESCYRRCSIYPNWTDHLTNRKDETIENQYTLREGIRKN